ncbi:MAG: nicotinate-nucleotide--dimethylbenzimidazole phosphoribosyltransferase [Sneathiellaceae bacterium]
MTDRRQTHPPDSPAAIARALDGPLERPDERAAGRVAARQVELTKPPGSLGRLEALCAWLAAWQGAGGPQARAPQVLVFAGNHGVADRGVSAFPAAVTAAMVANFRARGAAVNQLADLAGAGFAVHPLELDRPTGDFTSGPAMSEDEVVAAFGTGWAAVGDTDLLCLGEMGIGNTTAAAALCAALYGGDGAAWVGPGTGVDAAGLQRKAAVVDLGLARHAGIIGDPLQALRCLGGREIAAMAGAILAARYRRVPVLLDGFVCCAAAAVLQSRAPDALDHCLAAHVSAEPGHRRLLQRLGLVPLLDLEMRLGEASGAALALLLVRAALACHHGMATFADAAVPRDMAIGDGSTGDVAGRRGDG